MTSSVRITDFECTREAHAEKNYKVFTWIRNCRTWIINIIDETNEVITGLTIKLELLLWN